MENLYLDLVIFLMQDHQKRHILLFHIPGVMKNHKPKLMKFNKNLMKLLLKKIYIFTEKSFTIQLKEEKWK
jgi:hypothetical protein